MMKPADWNVVRSLMGMNWDLWVGNELGTDTRPEEAVLFIKNLINRWRCRVDLHWIAQRDRYNFFHSHPAYAIRLVQMGGYVEEVVPKGASIGNTYYRTWKPGQWGVVTPGYIHRVHRLLEPTGSLSLWIRGPVIREIMVGGFGTSGRLEMESVIDRFEEAT